MTAAVRSRFAVWAPTAESMTLNVHTDDQPEHECDLVRAPDGWWDLGDADRPVDDGGDVDYGYKISGSDLARPDPRSRWQPDGVHGLSRTFDPGSYRWSDQGWTGRQLAGSVIYELHVGTFTADGTLESAIERLDHLVDLGIDLVELMPVNAFNGTHNWGYDGVGWFAVQHTYGGPAAYQRFVDACHTRGLGVIQDVVYNHLGPSGNYLSEFGPYLAEGAANTWGDSVNLVGEESDQVRRFIIDNALMWLSDYHVDGLRLDAVHALVDTRAVHILEELSIEADALSAHLRRPIALIAESDLNDPRVITPREAGGYGLDGQWSDDFHHALLANLTGDTSGYYADFGKLDALAKVVQTGFFHDGTMSSFRGRRHGRRLDTPRTPCWRLVVCSDNHDQIGNRADGTRLRSRVTAAQLELAAVLTLLCPGTPMIFMGEEWGASTPFIFFTSHPEPELAEKTRTGRLEEFAKMDWDSSTAPDPQAIQTFTSSKLNWDESSAGEYAHLLQLYRDLIGLRRTWPDLTDPRFDWTNADFAEGQPWFAVTRGDISIVVNFGSEPACATVPDVVEVLLSSELHSPGDGTRTSESSAPDQVTLGGHGWAVLRLAPVVEDRGLG